MVDPVTSFAIGKHCDLLTCYPRAAADLVKEIEILLHLPLLNISVRDSLTPYIYPAPSLSPKKYNPTSRGFGLTLFSLVHFILEDFFTHSSRAHRGHLQQSSVP